MIDPFRIECDRVLNEMGYWKHRTARLERAVTMAVEALERESTTAPLLALLKSVLPLSVRIEDYMAISIAEYNALKAAAARAPPLRTPNEMRAEAGLKPIGGSPYVSASNFVEAPVVVYSSHGEWWVSYVVFPYGKRDRE